MSTQTVSTNADEFESYDYPGRRYDAHGEPIGVGPWVDVLARANRLATEDGQALPFPMPERDPWGGDPDTHVERYPEARVVIRLAEDPTEDTVSVVALSDRVADLLRRAAAEVHP
jgi:hypothetical protein